MGRGIGLSDEGLENASGGKYDVVNNKIVDLADDNPYVQAGIDSYNNDKKNRPTYRLANETMAQQNRSIQSALEAQYSGKDGNRLKHYDLYSNPRVE